MNKDWKPEWGDKSPGDLNAPWGRRDYGELLRTWPRDENGEPVTPAFLTQCAGLDLEDQLLVNMLQAYGIPCLTRYPGNGGFGKVVLGMSGFGVEIYVPETLLDDARALCEEGAPDEEEESNAL